MPELGTMLQTRWMPHHQDKWITKKQYD
eukprot:SAG22_NODE_7115_length_774_cov_1.125926_1_plen_27_part_10